MRLEPGGGLVKGHHGARPGRLDAGLQRRDVLSRFAQEELKGRFDDVVSAFVKFGGGVRIESMRCS